MDKCLIIGYNQGIRWLCNLLPHSLEICQDLMFKATYRIAYKAMRNCEIYAIACYEEFRTSRIPIDINIM